MIKSYLFYCAPSAKDAVDLIMSAIDMVDPAFNKIIDDEDFNEEDPPVKYWFSGWQGEEEDLAKAISVLSGIPGIIIIRSVAVGLESEDMASDNENAEPSLETRTTSRAAIEIAKRKISEFETALSALVDE